MRYKTILKEFNKIEQLLNAKDKAKKEKGFKALRELKSKISYKVKEEEQKKLNQNPDVHNLSRWYYGLWNGKIPEINYSRASKTFKELLEEGNLDKEEIKELYYWWLNLDEEKITDNKLKFKYSIILTGKNSRSIIDFKSKYRYIKDLKAELEKSQKGWISEEYKHDESIYGKSVLDADQIAQPIEENDEDIPF